MILPYDVFEMIAKHCDSVTFLNLVKSNTRFIQQFKAKKHIATLGHDQIISGSIHIHTKSQDGYRVERFIKLLKRVFAIDHTQNTLDINRFFGVYMYMIVVKDIDQFVAGVHKLFAERAKFPEFTIKNVALSFTPGHADEITDIFAYLGNHEKMVVMTTPKNQSYCLYNNLAEEHDVVFVPRALQALLM